MTPDEVRMLDNRYALLFIRGERPIMDEKIDPFKHPNVKLSALGGAPVYEHGGTENAVAVLSVTDTDLSGLPVLEIEENSYELIPDEELEQLTD